MAQELATGLDMLVLVRHIGQEPMDETWGPTQLPMRLTTSDPNPEQMN